MKKIKYVWLAVLCLVVAGLAGSAQAQRQKGGDSEAAQQPSGPVGSVTVNALQISDGELAFHYRLQTDTTFGLTFLGQTFGDFPGTLTVSLNAVSNSETGNGPVGGSSSITGGSWTLPVYRTDVRGGFVGSIYGEISNGQIIPTKTENKFQVFMVFAIQGGTLAYQGATGTATFSGTLTIDARGAGSDELEGNLVFNTSPD